MMIKLSKSDNKGKKYRVEIDLGDTSKVIHFGDNRHSDYTIHKDPKRKQNYISRHRHNENWGKNGINTAGFWSKNLLWNKPTLGASIRNIQDKFNVKIISGV